MKRRVKYVKLHGGDAFIPGIGGLGNTLPPQNKTLNLNMYYYESNLYLEVNGQEAVIPGANIQIMVLYSEDKPTLVRDSVA